MSSVVKLVAQESNPELVKFIEELLVRAKSGELIAMVVACATSYSWETNVSQGTPILEAMGYLDVVKSILSAEYLDKEVTVER